MKSLCLILILIAFSFNSFASDIVPNGLRPWQWQKSKCDRCPLYFKVNSNIEFDDRVLEFKKALESERETIVQIYDIDPQEYNLLAWISLGILGRESDFYQSKRYRLKEAFPWLVTELKKINSNIKDSAISSNSRGPTQIKNIPDLIERHYGFTTSDLNNPKFAAVATVGFLIEALTELKLKADKYNLKHINESNYVDYIPYIYFGRSKALIQRTATPETNVYVQEMKRHMKKFQPFEELR